MPYYWIKVNNSTGEFGYGVSDHPQDDGILSNGFSLIYLTPPFDEVTTSALSNPPAYLYQNGEFVANPAYDASAVALAQAKTAQTAAIEDAYAQALAAGLVSSADGTKRTYLVNDTIISDIGLARTITEASYPASGIEAELIDGTYVSLSYAQMQTLSDDLQAFYLPLRSKRIKLLSQIKTATTVEAVQAVTW